MIKQSLFFQYSCTFLFNWIGSRDERKQVPEFEKPAVSIRRSQACIRQCSARALANAATSFCINSMRGRKVGYLRWAAADGDWGPSFERKTGRQEDKEKTRKRHHVHSSQPAAYCLIGGPEACRPQNRWGWTTGVWWVAGLNSVNSTFRIC